LAARHLIGFDATELERLLALADGEAGSHDAEDAGSRRAERERVFGPDDEGRPLAAGGGGSTLQGVQLGALRNVDESAAAGGNE
jgi:hypothetical protein